MKKILYTASVDIHFKAFHIPTFKMLKNHGHNIHVASNGDSYIECVDQKFDIPFERSPFNKSNIKAYKHLKKIISENNYDIIHCHTPVTSILTRLVARKARKSGTKVIYTAHGFHFFKGAPVLNWLIYYPIERFCARFTDVLITINKEDYERAKRFNVKRVEYIPGVGIDTQSFKNMSVNIKQKRIELEIPEDAFLILSVGELNKNKNHRVIIKALSKIKNPNIYYCICGQGDSKSNLISLAQRLGIKNAVKFVGFRNDISEIYKIAQIFAFPSKREGLPVALMEAMAAGLPCVASKIRGNVDLIENLESDFLIKPTDVAGFAKAIKTLIDNTNLRTKMGQYNIKFVTKFDLNNVNPKMLEIYNSSHTEIVKDIHSKKRCAFVGTKNQLTEEKEC